jgi:hypothetical protein
MPNELDRLRKNCKKLKEEVDINVHDRLITFTEWKKSSKQSDGEEKWKEFKENFIKEQKKYGFIWNAVQGYAGPIELKSVELQSDIGRILAEKAYKDGIKEGHFVNDILKQYIPELFDYLGEEFVTTNLSFSDVKDEFKSKTIDNKVYKCSGYAGVKFKQSTSEYKYASGQNDRKKEYSFGQLIINSENGKAFFNGLGLVFFEHVQNSRKSGKYQNVDFQGFKIKRTMDEDYFVMYNFELKPSNEIPQISTAISQAINYKEKANYTYIIIPQFDHDSFYDSERYVNLMDLCKKNQIGIISVRMSSNNEVDDVLEVLPAEETRIADYSDLKRLTDNQGYEKCPVCYKIVKNDQKREGCGWRIVFDDGEGNEQQGCMKTSLGEMVIKNLENK